MRRGVEIKDFAATNGAKHAGEERKCNNNSGNLGYSGVVMATSSLGKLTKQYQQGFATEVPGSGHLNCYLRATR